MATSIREKVIEITAEQLHVPASELSDETRFDAVGADSLDRIELATC